MQLSKWAHDLAESLLADSLPRRWAHSQRVYSQAMTLRRAGRGLPVSRASAQDP